MRYLSYFFCLSLFFLCACGGSDSDEPTPNPDGSESYSCEDYILQLNISSIGNEEWYTSHSSSLSSIPSTETTENLTETKERSQNKFVFNFNLKIKSNTATFTAKETEKFVAETISFVQHSKKYQVGTYSVGNAEIEVREDGIFYGNSFLCENPIIYRTDEVVTASREFTKDDLFAASTVYVDGQPLKFKDKSHEYQITRKSDKIFILDKISLPDIYDIELEKD